MRYDPLRRTEYDEDVEPSARPAGIPGKMSLSHKLYFGMPKGADRSTATTAPSVANDQARPRDPGELERAAAAAFIGESPPADSQRLPDDLRGELETALDADLGGMRVHTDAGAARSAERHDARAFAQGQDVYFGAGAYDPSSPAGRRLIAHEAAHTVQQQGAAQTVQHDTSISEASDAHEIEAETFAQAFVRGGSAPVTRGSIGAGAISRDGLFVPQFGGDAGVGVDALLNDLEKLVPTISNAKSAPSGTSFDWKWGQDEHSELVKKSIVEAGSKATFALQTVAPTAGDLQIGAAVEVTEPEKSPHTHVVSPAMKVSVGKPDFVVTQELKPSATGGGSSQSTMRPTDELEIRVDIMGVADVDAVTSSDGSFRSDDGVYLTQVAGQAVAETDEPFEVGVPYWDDGMLVFTATAHHAGKGTVSCEVDTMGETFRADVPVGCETTLAYFKDRVAAAGPRYLALISAYDSFFLDSFRNYKAAYESVDAVLQEVAERDKLTNDILMGVLFAGIGGAAGGALAGGLKNLIADKTSAIVGKTLQNAVAGALSDAPKDIAKYTARLGKLATGSGKAPHPDDATPMLDGPGAGAGGGVSLDPLDWYAVVSSARATESAGMLEKISGWQTKVTQLIAQGATETIDWDPVNAVTDVTKIAGRTLDALGPPIAKSTYQKSMWEAWLLAYGYRAEYTEGGFGLLAGKSAAQTANPGVVKRIRKLEATLAEDGIATGWVDAALHAAKAEVELEIAKEEDPAHYEALIKPQYEGHLDDIAAKFSVGDHVSAQWVVDDRYYPGVILEIEDGEALIRWDGYDEDSDWWAAVNRMKKLD